MERGIKYPTSRITRLADKDGQSLEEQLRKMTDGKEPIQLTAKIEYNERKLGVLPSHDIRSDRFDYAMTAMDKVHATQMATRMAQDGFVKDDKGNWVENNENKD